MSIKVLGLCISLSLSGVAFAAEPFCDSGVIHPIDATFERDMDASGGITANMRDVQIRAYEAWDAELNREYRELMALLPENEKPVLREAQRAWLAFQKAESDLWWTTTLSSDGGTIRPIIVSDLGREFLKNRVCQLRRYKAGAFGNVDG